MMQYTGFQCIRDSFDRDSLECLITLQCLHYLEHLSLDQLLRSLALETSSLSSQNWISAVFALSHFRLQTLSNLRVFLFSNFIAKVRQHWKNKVIEERATVHIPWGCQSDHMWRRRVRRDEKTKQTKKKQKKTLELVKHNKKLKPQASKLRSYFHKLNVSRVWLNRTFLNHSSAHCPVLTTRVHAVQAISTNADRTSHPNTRLGWVRFNSVPSSPLLQKQDRYVYCGYFLQKCIHIHMVQWESTVHRLP